MHEFNPKDVFETCPYCWKNPCNCLEYRLEPHVRICKDCQEKDKEIEKLKNLLALAGVGY